MTWFEQAEAGGRGRLRGRVPSTVQEGYRLHPTTLSYRRVTGSILPRYLTGGLQAPSYHAILQEGYWPILPRYLTGGLQAPSYHAILQEGYRLHPTTLSYRRVTGSILPRYLTGGLLAPSYHAILQEGYRLHPTTLSNRRAKVSRRRFA
jgi:hypothetical protein